MITVFQRTMSTSSGQAIKVGNYFASLARCFMGKRRLCKLDRYLKTQTASKHFHPEVKAMRYILNVSLMLQSFPNKACF